MMLLRQKPVWLYALVCMPPIAGVLNLYAGGTPLLKGHAAPVVFTVALCAVAVVLWLPFSSEQRWSRLGALSVGLLWVAWFSLLLLLRREGNSLDFGTVAPGLLVALVLVKPPTLIQAFRAAQVFGVAVVISSVSTLLLEPFALLPTGFFAEAGGGLRITALANIGIDTRWSGPFIHSNLAGPVGGAVVILGLASQRLLKVGLVAGGVLILVLTQSRTGLLSLVLALALWWLLHSWSRAGRIDPRALIGSSAVLLVVAAYVAWRDPTLDGRTPAWIDYFNLMISSPGVGVGNLGVDSYLAENADRVVDFAQPHAHNFLLDLGGRWGVPMFILSSAILVLSLWLGLRAAKRGTQLGLILAIFMVIVGISERPFTWSHASPLMMVFFLGLLLSASADGRPRKRDDVANEVRSIP